MTDVELKAALEVGYFFKTNEYKNYLIFSLIPAIPPISDTPHLV